MKTENKFTEVMAQRSYDELIEIVGKMRNEYQPEAIIAAEEELKKRKPPEEIVETKDKKNKKLNIIDRANLPLDSFTKIYTMLFPRLYRLLFDFELKDKGYLRQYKEWRQWTFIGVFFYIGIFIMVFLITILVEYCSIP